ncbi:hypothetical protein TIFTF001_020600 [Ficus carica]|uniref:glutamate decarboxylase n=1 Tax=Ficus carica TaxID=3494 RepID=A0AA88ARS6_FICCA|nr:hypothetical protein TIFTF001_020600 [Ficus carica]
MVISEARSSSSKIDDDDGKGEEYVNSTFGSRYVRKALPKWRMPEESIPKEAAYQIISDELMLDGRPRLNLASFVTTWMEPESDQLILASLNKNYVDMDEYPVTTEIQELNLGESAFSSISSSLSSKNYGGIGAGNGSRGGRGESLLVRARASCQTLVKFFLTLSPRSWLTSKLSPPPLPSPPAPITPEISKQIDCNVEENVDLPRV